MKKRLSVLLFSLALSVSCSTQISPTSSDKLTEIKEKKVNSNTITGVVQFQLTPNSSLRNRGGFNTKAIDEIAKDTTVSIIYPHDYIDSTKANKIIATGLTDSTGSFEISPNFVPNNNEIFVLEATKRTGGVGNSLMTVRTIIKKVADGWESMTTPVIYINSYTTALAIVSGYNSSTLPTPDTLSKINMSGNSPVIPDINGITSQTIINVEKLVDSVLNQGKDPFAVIKFLNGTYSIDQRANIQQLNQTNNCSGCSLMGVDLSNTSLAGKDLSYASLRGQDLSNKDLSGTILIGADLRDATLPNDLSYLNLSEANLSGQNLIDKNLTGTNFSKANLTDTKLSSSVNPHDLTKTRLSGANLTNADLSNANLKKVNLFETIFKETDIKNVNFEQADMTGVDLSEVKNNNFSGISFKNTNLEGSSFSNESIDFKSFDLSTANVKGTNFSNTHINLFDPDTYETKILNKNLENCNFSNATINWGFPESYKMNKSSFENAKLGNAWIMGDCIDCNFFNVESIYGGSTIKGNLQNSSFENAKKISVSGNLRKTNFKNAQLGNVESTDLSYSDFTNVKANVVKTSKADNAIFDGANLYSFEHLYDGASKPFVISNAILNLKINGVDIKKDKEIYSLYSGDKYKFYNIFENIINTYNDSFEHFNNFIQGVGYVFEATLKKDVLHSLSYDFSEIDHINELTHYTHYFSVLNKADPNRFINMYDEIPPSAIKNFSFKNASGDISGLFVKSNFSGSTFKYYENSTILRKPMYFNHCNLNNVKITPYPIVFDDSKSIEFSYPSLISIGSTFSGAQISFLKNSYLKDTNISLDWFNGITINSNLTSKYLHIPNSMEDFFHPIISFNSKFYNNNNHSSTCGNVIINEDLSPIEYTYNSGIYNSYIDSSWSSKRSWKIKKSIKSDFDICY